MLDQLCAIDHSCSVQNNKGKRQPNLKT